MAILLAGQLGDRAKPTLASEQSPVRIGWQVPWATQGQLVQGLKHTNIAQSVGVNLEFSGFAYGAPLNQAAMARQVDVVLTADQPAIVLLAHTHEFRIVARMMYNRTCIYVPISSRIRSLKDLSGKRLLGPVGAAAERVATEALQSAGLDPMAVQLGNLGMEQQLALVRSATGNSEWPGADALYGFDPIPAQLQIEHQARMLHCGKVTSVVMASESMLTNRRSELIAFLRAFVLSWGFYAQHPTVANRWFSDEARMSLSDEVLDLAASIEPNRWVKSPSKISIALSLDDISSLRHAQAFLVERKMIESPPDLLSSIDSTALRAAMDDFSIAEHLKRITWR